MNTLALATSDLACVPDAIPAQERAGHFALARELLIERAREQTDHENGYAFRFDADALTSLVLFVENERKCCPFMTFEIVVAPGSGPIWLRMTGPDGTCEVLRAELSLSDTYACRVRAENPKSTAAANIECQCGTRARANKGLARWTAIGGVFAALGLCAACCLLPAVLLGMGVAGAWVSSMESLAAYQWTFVLATVALLGFGFYRAYWRPKPACAAGAACENCKSDWSLRMGLWVGTLLAIGGIIYGYLVPWLTD